MNFCDGSSIGFYSFLAGWTPKVVVGDGDVWNLKNCKTKQILNYIFLT